MPSIDTMKPFFERFLSNLPVNWFSSTAKGSSDDNTSEDAVEQAKPGNTFALAKAEATVSAILQEDLSTVEQQMTLLNATAPQLDGIAKDYFGDTMLRRTGESNSAFRARIVSRLFTPGGTRLVMSENSQKTTGYVPFIMERMTGAEFLGGYLGGTVDAADVGVLAYDVAGMYYEELNEYTAKITIKQAEPGSTYFMTVDELQAFVDSIKPYGTTMVLQVIGPDSTGGVPIN